MLGQKAEFPWQPWDIFRSGKILVGPISISNYPLCYGRQVKCQTERNFSIDSAPKGRSEFRCQWELRTVSSVPIHEIKTEILNQLRAQLTKKKSNWKGCVGRKGGGCTAPGWQPALPQCQQTDLAAAPGPWTTDRTGISYWHSNTSHRRWLRNLYLVPFGGTTTVSSHLMNIPAFTTKENWNTVGEGAERGRLSMWSDVSCLPPRAPQPGPREDSLHLNKGGQRGTNVITKT